MEFLLSSKCCANLELPLLNFEIVKTFPKSFVKRTSSLAYIFFLAVFTGQLIYAIFVKFLFLVISSIVSRRRHHHHHYYYY